MPNDVSREWKNFVPVHNRTFQIQGAETHWYFIEGALAYKEKLYLASLLSYLNSIESSLRTTCMYFNEGYENDKLSGTVLSNRLLRDAENIGLNVDLLAFPDEIDFHKNLQHNNPLVEIVRNRHNLCHGNLFEYFKVHPETGDKYFTPECLKELATIIKIISEKWATEIYKFKK